MRRLSPARPQTRLAWLALLAGLAGAVAPARAELLDYPSSFGNFYGDQPGVLDVDHWVNHLGQRVDGLHWWSMGYDELQGVAWSAYNSAGTVAHIDLRVLDGQPLRLDGFRLGSWAGAEGRVETVTVTPYGGGAPVYSFTGVIGLNNLSNRFDLGLSSATGFSIAWTNPWWTAIDDIRFQTSAVPEQGTAALLIAGLGVLALRARRRRSPDAPPD
jgi:MYXO-CTERM domain-containing protein